VRTVHVVDDSEADRAMVVRLLGKSWTLGQGPPARPEVVEWSFVWDLLAERQLSENDLVLADLYPSEYWTVVPTPKPVKLDARPNDPTNFFNASVDMVDRFLVQVPARGADLILMTYVPHYMERELEVEIAGGKLRDFLQAQPLTLIEKERRFGDEDAVQRAVAAANKVLCR